MKNKSLQLILLFLLVSTMGKAQSLRLDGVYVGAELYNTVYDGLQINSRVFYFRSGGTFSDKLNIPSWRTNVSGNYAIKNGFVELKFNNGDKALRYKLNNNGSLGSVEGIKHTLHKVKKVSVLPAAGYERKTASSSGGMGTGMPNVFSSSSGFLYFDGKGNFSLSRSGIVSVGGDVSGGTIGGKFEKNSKATSGKYKLGDGEITFTFNDGKVSKHSFFYSPADEEDLILLDGEFYFRDEAKRSSNTEEEVVTDQTTEKSAGESALPKATNLLKKLRFNYGGENIDKITTVRETANMSGNLKAIALTDIVNNRIRAEIWRGSKLVLVRQLEVNNGWQWMNGVKKPLSQDEKVEMKLSLYQGILGLHRKLNQSFLQGTVAESKGDYMLTFFVEGNKLVYLVGSDYSLKANGYSINGSPNFSVYQSFGSTKGVKYPATTQFSNGKTNIVINTTSMEINPVLTNDDWKTP